MNYQEKKQARIERYEALAEKNRAKASELHEEARRMASVIPFGQPIIVGHHSESRDRNFRNKIHNKFGQSFETANKAEYYEQKAQSAINNTAISSDDPEAAKLLKEKIEKAEKLQEMMKSANKIIKGKKQTEEQKIEGLKKIGFSELNAKKLFTPDFCGRLGFASFQLSNNNANIRRMKERLTELEKKQKDTTTEHEINGAKIVDNVEENRLQIFFDSIPEEETRKKLKQNGFKWSRYNGCWQRMRSNRATSVAKDILVNIT